MISAYQGKPRSWHLSFCQFVDLDFLACASIGQSIKSSSKDVKERWSAGDLGRGTQVGSEQGERQANQQRTMIIKYYHNQIYKIYIRSPGLLS